MSRTDRIIAWSVGSAAVVAGVAAVALRLQYAEVLYLKRVMATLAGCW